MQASHDEHGGPSISRQENEALAQRISDVWNAHDLGAVAALYAVDAVSRDNTMDEVRGRDELRARGEAFLTAFPDLRLEILAHVAGEDRVATHWRMTGTHNGELLGFEPTGREVEIVGQTMMLLDDAGLIRREDLSWDTARLMQDLGAMPPAH